MAKVSLVKLPSCSCLCSIHWSQVLSREWRCSNYTWVINNFISYYGAAYIRCLTIIESNTLTSPGVTGLYPSRLGICQPSSGALVTMATGERDTSKSVTVWGHTMRTFITSRKCKTPKMSLWQYDITRPQWVNKCSLSTEKRLCP